MKILVYVLMLIVIIMLLIVGVMFGQQIYKEYKYKPLAEACGFDKGSIKMECGCDGHQFRDESFGPTYVKCYPKCNQDLCKCFEAYYPPGHDVKNPLYKNVSCELILPE
jgi:hypothetical protein